MKILKKINKGLILTIIVLLALTIYLVQIEKQRNEEKDDIKEVCEKFIDFTDKYLVLPEEMQILDRELSENEEQQHINKMEEELEKLMIQNEEAVKIQQQFLVSTLKNGYKSNQIKSKIEREITKITNYEFEGNQVTVTFNSKVKNNVKYLNEENKEQSNCRSDKEKHCRALLSQG